MRACSNDKGHMHEGKETSINVRNRKLEAERLQRDQSAKIKAYLYVSVDERVVLQNEVLDLGV